MQDACNEYEGEKETDTDEERGQRFERLVITMQKVIIIIIKKTKN